MICHNCGKVVSFEKLVTPDGRCYHLECWSAEEEEKHPLEDK
tara:strand:+ start:233 stop:358 length:126 start_codon:yes stop_codon:yes gene_type:complete